MKINKNCIVTLSFLTMLSFFPITTMQEPNSKLPHSYLDLINVVSDDTETENRKLRNDYKASELMLGNLYLSHLISQYIPQETIELRKKDCVQAIEALNPSQFKNSFAMLKIVTTQFNEKTSNNDSIEINTVKVIKDYKPFKSTFLHLICDKNVQQHVSTNNQSNEIQSPQIAIIEELIKNNINLNAKDNLGETATHKIIQKIIFISNQINNNSPLAAILSPSNNIVISPMLKHYNTILKMLVDAGTNIHEKVPRFGDIDDKCSPLSYAIERYNITAVKMLLDLGAAQDETFLMDMSFSYDKKFKQKLDEICNVTILQKGVRMQRIFESNMIRISLAPKNEGPSSCPIS